MNYYFDTFSTSLCDFSVAVDENNSVIATAFGDSDVLKQRFSGEKLVRDTKRTTEVRQQIRAYFEGERRDFHLDLNLIGTPFQKEVWAALQQIPFGETRSYGDIAAQIGSPAASRAVGRANATNPICLIIPCHRVIGKDGSLTGFAFGENIKRQLLEHEGYLSPALI